MPRPWFRSLAPWCSLTLAQTAPAAVLHVDAAAPPGGDGVAWATAFDDLQAALAAAQPGDEVWIARGVYTPSPADTTVSFDLRPGVALYGGFAGTETERDARDWAANESILSGDLGHDDTLHPIAFNTPNSGHVLTATGVDATAVIDGLVVEHGAYGPPGTPAGDPLLCGSGLYAVNASPTVRNCTFRVNYAAFGSGGAVHLWDSSPQFTGCVFEDNYVHLGNGGAVYMGGNSGSSFTGCTFRRNTCVFATPDASGGGIHHYSTAPLAVTDCTFEGNQVRPFYSTGNDLGYGGGISSFSAPITVSNCTFRNNTASTGGGMIAWNEATVTNCLFDGNNAQARAGSLGELGGWGGGFAAYSFVAREMLLVNCTFVGNRSKEYGGVGGEWNATAVLRNCILWDNSGWNPEIVGYYREQIGGNFDLRCCDIQGIFGLAGVGEDPLEPDKLVGCTDADPLFAGPGDFRLLPGSPAIDSGDNAAWVGGGVDLAGLPRLADDPATADTGLGAAPIIDMGAYERQGSPPCPADIDANGVLNVDDVDAFVAAFLGSLPTGDCDGSGALNVDDVDCFVGSFLGGCR